MDDDVLAVVQASAMRRLLGITMLFALGMLLIYVAFATPPTPLWQAFLLALGAGAMLMGERLRRATLGRIELTAAGLRDQSGDEIVPLAQIRSIDRGAFAFKPSNGFLLRLSAPMPRRWEPGLWWRAGRRIGVGGVTGAGQTKFMAEMIAAMLAERS